MYMYTGVLYYTCTNVVSIIITLKWFPNSSSTFNNIIPTSCARQLSIVMYISTESSPPALGISDDLDMPPGVNDADLD